MKDYEGVCPKCESGNIFTCDCEFTEKGLLVGCECQDCGKGFNIICTDMKIMGR
jgi:hypothetical protein